VKKTCNPSTQEAETGVPGQPGLHSEMLSQKKKKKKKTKKKKEKNEDSFFSRFVRLEHFGYFHQ
jgi:hypothetical protein